MYFNIILSNGRYIINNNTTYPSFVCYKLVWVFLNLSNVWVPIHYYSINIDLINDENHIGTIGKLINPLLNLKYKNIKQLKTKIKLN